MKIIATTLEEFQELDAIVKKVISLSGSDIENDFESIEKWAMDIPKFKSKPGHIKKFLIPKGSKLSMIRFPQSNNTISVIIDIVLDNKDIEFELNGFETLSDFTILQSHH